MMRKKLVLVLLVFVFVNLFSVPITHGQDQFNFVGEDGQATWFLMIEPPGQPLTWWIVAESNPGFGDPASPPDRNEGDGLAFGPCFILGILGFTVGSGFGWRHTPVLGNAAGGRATGVSWAIEGRSNTPTTTATYVGRGNFVSQDRIEGTVWVIKDTMDSSLPNFNSQLGVNVDVRRFFMVRARESDTPCEAPRR
jgi:hypothetical protein